MNHDQITSVVRWVISVVGGAIAGYFAARGWATAEQVLDFLNSGAFIGFIVAIIALVWSMFRNSDKGILESASRMPAVKEIVTTPKVANVVMRDDPKVVSSERSRADDLK